MFEPLQHGVPALSRYRVIGFSVAAHVALLAVVAFHNPYLTDTTSTWLTWGDSDHSYRITYLPAAKDPTLAQEKPLTLPSSNGLIQPQLPKTQRARTSHSSEPRQPEPQADAGDRDTRAGSLVGSVLDGPITGHEIHVAYPVVYPDPIARDELPRDLTGDAIIEVTIDAQGNVIATRILQAVGHGLDEKIEATLRLWHYQPATLDGVPVASRHDVHFHFPS